MKLNPNCSEVVFRLKMPKGSEFDEDIDKFITKVMKKFEPHTYDKESNNEFVLYAENDGDAIFIRERCDGSNDDKLEWLNKEAKARKIIVEEIGDEADFPLFSANNNLFYTLKGVVKVFDLSYTNNETANRIHKKLLKEWKIK